VGYVTGQGRAARRTRAGGAEIPLDYSRVPTLQAGLEEAARLDKRFSQLAKESFGPPGEGEKLLMSSHLPLFSMINRAVSLHRGIVAMIKQENPHATFTLMRAYLELVVFAYYVNKHPSYLASIERPASELPKRRGRKTFQALLNEAAKEMGGVRKVYASLSEMAHFGSTALWHPFTVGEDPEERLLKYGTPPHWKRPDDARMAVAMLLENDDAALYVLADFAQTHVVPGVMAALAAGVDWNSLADEDDPASVFGDLGTP
jgi:hypothetical protein